MYPFKFKDGKKARQESQVRWSKLTSKSNKYKYNNKAQNGNKRNPKHRAGKTVDYFQSSDQRLTDITTPPQVI